ncbi:DsbA family protein [Oceanobacillus bengalensis]|uniref:DsbA family protein n=1 Tax=Oceanobacillus bengalensis TaxID=1435466 RepID=A0A494Z750_9BACI|nr:thioredoxin domain-containing protein [Oceanobacillus bengalensis]RKQ18325.1 DsbA family protein [Oceanobacillus bengalensis]
MKIVVIITSLVFLLGVALVVLTNDNSEKETYTEQPDIEGQPVLGEDDEDDALVTVVEFGDFKCPACKAWGETIFPQLTNDYIDTEEVRFSYINTPFHGTESTLASLAAETVLDQNPDAYWDFHNALFAEQPSSNHDNQWVTVDKILEVANEIQTIDIEELELALEEQSKIEEVNKDVELVEDFNVQMTPSIMVNDIMVEDPFDYEAIKNLIEQELEG